MNRDRYFHAQCVNDAFLWLAREIYYRPDHIVSPRGQTTREVVCIHVEISNPYQRVVTNRYRNVSLRYGIGEWLWYERASNRVDEIAAYSKFWTQVSDDQLTVNSGYGYRIFGKHPKIEVNQWSYVRSELSADKDSRRALCILVMPFDAATPTKDFPCTVSLQFFIRDNRLHLVASMRSNDLIRGFTNDVFAFTLFQEQMMLELQQVHPELTIGEYHHIATSMHIYERHYPMVENILAHSSENITYHIPHMHDLTELEILLYNEEIIRTGQQHPLKNLTDPFCLFCQAILLGGEI